MSADLPSLNQADPSNLPTPSGERPSPSASSIAGRLAGSSLIYGLANFALKAIGFLLLPLYTRFLVPADFGIVTLSEILAVPVALACTLGLENGLQRLYFEYTPDPPALARYISTVLRSSIALAMCVLVISFAAGPSLLKFVAPHFSVSFFPFIALAIGTATASQLVQVRLALYQVEQRHIPYVLLAAALFATTAVAVISLVVVRHDGALGMLLGKFLAVLLVVVVVGVMMRKLISPDWDWSLLRESLRLSLPQLPFQFAAIGLVAADRLILEHYRSVSEVGIYSLAYTLGATMHLVVISLSLAWTPMFYELAGQGEEGRRILGRISSGLMVVLIGIATFGILIAEDFVHLVFDHRYWAAGRIVPWMIGVFLLHGFFYLFQLSAVYAKRTEFLSLVGVFAFVVSVALNLVFIPQWGIYGAASATLLGFAVEAALMYFCGQRLYYVPYDKMKLIGSLVIFPAALAWAQSNSSAGTHFARTAAGLAIFAGLLAWIGRREILQSLRLLRNYVRLSARM